MSTATATAAALAVPRPETRLDPASARTSVADLVRPYFQLWLRCCDEFLDWQRDHVLRDVPSPETLSRHREALKWILRATRLLHCEASDPDCPEVGWACQLAARLRQLEQSWQAVHQPMPDREADAILRDTFPNGDRFGG